jgi:hypothetical protein
MPSEPLPELRPELLPEPGPLAVAAPEGVVSLRARLARRSRVPVAAGLAGLLAVTLTSAVAAPGATAAPGPAVTLVAGAKAVEARRFEGYLEVDLGIHLVATTAPVSITARRAAYGKPVTATMTVGRTTRTLPAGMVDLEGLQDFTTVTVKDARGRVVGTETMPFCPGDGGRARPDAPAASPYPQGCSTGPFAFATVYGLQRGWASRLPVSLPDELKDGTYTVTTQLGARWRSVLGVPVARSSVTTTVTVKTVKESDEGAPGAVHGGAVGQRGHAVPRVPSGASDRAALQAYRAADAARATLLSQLAAAAAASGAASAPTSATLARALPGAAMRPDLRSLPAFSISVMKGKDLGKEDDPARAEREYLTFAASTWNAGPAPLVVEGFRRPGSDVMDAYQYFYSGSRESSYRKVGTMAYHAAPEHDHWHFLDFAQYNLLDAKGKQVLRSGKQAWCLAPTDSVDLTLRGAAWNPGATGLFSTCGQRGALSIREALPVGWADTYGQYQVGDAFDITAVPNGRYQIQVVANPAKRLLETSTSNNTSLRTVILSGAKGARTVTVPPHQGIDTEGGSPSPGGRG